MPYVEEQPRPSIQKILLATNSSESWEAILAYVAGLARQSGASISLADVTSAEVICAIVSNREVDLVVVPTSRSWRKLGTPSTAEDILTLGKT